MTLLVRQDITTNSDLVARVGLQISDPVRSRVRGYVGHMPPVWFVNRVWNVESNGDCKAPKGSFHIFGVVPRNQQCVSV
uniref:Phage tail protein n=1 Tax=Mesocestoides corti TaxID=53468 RepID=A0A5K3G3N9_MESCO